MGSYISMEDMNDIEYSLTRKKDIKNYVNLYNHTLTVYNLFIIYISILISIFIYCMINLYD